MTAKHGDPLDVSLRELLARVFDPRTAGSDPERWIDARDPDQCPVPWRNVLDAARRGELEASRVGRQVLVRARELDRWLTARRIESRVAEPPVSTPAPPEPSRIAHLLDRAGYVPRARTKP
jgi:excisionase family DNA binding protein